MLPNEAAGDLGGPPRLARWIEGPRAERERVAGLAAAGVSDAAAYEEPGARERVRLRRSTNALTPLVGLREQRRRASEAAERSRRSSTSSEEDSMPIRVAWRARKEKRTRSLTSSGRTAAAMEDAGGGGAESSPVVTGLVLVGLDRYSRGFGSPWL